jgi:uncharacterized 2Fe-2S/4Fe-4S cluster protein (DUF4445 family)
MVLARNGSLAASSTAAGPAFEGMNISCGMRASRGAIESFSIAGDSFSFEVIGKDETWSAGEKITGICGSGLLDIAGELVRTGLIGKNGRLAKRETLTGKIARQLRPLPEPADNTTPPRQDSEPVKTGIKNAFFITEEVYLSQQDIRQIQLAKGAIRCGIEMLLSRFGLNAADVDSVEIAGAFGFHLRESSLLNIGLLPPEFAGKVAFIGNTSMTGAAAFLMNRDFREEMRETARKVDQIELADDKDFEKNFVRFMTF